MRLISNREIKLDTPLWEPELFGIFAKLNEDVCFCFANRRTINVYMQSNFKSDFSLRCLDEYSFTLPYHWKWYRLRASSFLLLSESLGINMEKQQLISPLPAELLDEYTKDALPEKHLVEDPFFFDDYCIAHKGMTGYRCTKNGKHLWDFQGRAYLYTEMIRYQNCVFFATSGHGGYFYALDLETGEAIASIKTGGPYCIAQKDNLCYFLRFDSKTELVCFDLQSEQIVDSIILPGKATSDSRLQMIDNMIHTVTFQYQKDRLLSAVWHTIQI